MFCVQGLEAHCRWVYRQCKKKVVDGGFHIQAPYTAAQLYELAKMDGAIILSKDIQKKSSMQTYS